MYVYAWLALVIISLTVSLAAFVWGLASGQFSEQARARYLPLRDQAAPVPQGDPARLPVEVYVLIAVVVCVLLLMLAPAILTLCPGGRG